MNERVVSYEADFDQEFEGLTEKHKAIKSQLETALSQYLKNKKGKPVTIQGPYGSGKTQLLYHLFKFIWENGGIGIYTHLERIIPRQDVEPSEYAEYLKELMSKEIDLLRKGESKLMTGKVKNYAVSSIKQINSNNNSIVLLVDEVEQRYKLLDEKVSTDDHSPMRDTIARVNNGEAGFYLVLAFAPVSFYEFSKGEAQTGRFLPRILPIIEPKTFRKFFEEIGNLIWWMGKGRYRSVSRTQDIFDANVSNIDKISKKELLDVCRNIGSTGGVPALEFESIEKIDAFEDFREFLIHLGPKESGGEIYSGATKIIKKCLLYKDEKHNLNDILEKSLRGSRVSKVTDIGYYLSVILDALSTSDGKMPLFTEADDWKELLKIVEDIILEFEGEDRLPSEDLRKLQDVVSEFSYKIRHTAEKTSKLKEGYCITPSFLRILFPFPISSPNLIPDKKIEEQRENLGDQTYLGREERNSILVFFFLNERKIREYLVQESKSFLKETKALVAVNLGRGKVNNIPKLARWLWNQGRLKIITPTGILSDFLVSFFYLVRDEKKESLPISSLLKKLEENRSISQKDRARKIAYYDSRIREYLNSELPKIPPPKYKLIDKTGFDDFMTGRVGYASELIGFAFVDSKHDMGALHEFRYAFESSEFIKKESKGTGVPSALEKGRPVTTDKKTKGIIKGAVLRRISDSFSKHLPDLTEVVNEMSRDECVTIPADDDSEQIFEGIYLYLRDWNDHSKAVEKFRDIKSKWDEIAGNIDKLSGEIEEFQKLTDGNIILTHCIEVDKSKIKKIQKILDEYQTKISPYTKFLFSTFIEKTSDVLESKLIEIEKKFRKFKHDVEDQITKYKSEIENIKNFEKDVFKWMNENKDEVQKEFQQKFSEVCRDFTKSEKIDLEKVTDVDSFIESVKETVNELQVLKEINESIKQCKTKAYEINKKLGEWGAG